MNAESSHPDRRALLRVFILLLLIVATVIVVCVLTDPVALKWVILALATALGTCLLGLLEGWIPGSLARAASLLRSIWPWVRPGGQNPTNHDRDQAPSRADTT